MKLYKLTAACALIVAAASIATFAITDEITKITVLDKYGTSRTVFNSSNIESIEVEEHSHSYTIEPVDDKSAWHVLYGSIAMPYYNTYNTARNGGFAAAIDNVVDNAGWMSHVCDSYSRSQNLGDPYMVVDLGTEYPLARIGLRIGDLDGGAYDVLPKKIEIYSTDRNPAFSFNPEPIYTDPDSPLFLRVDGQIVKVDRKYTDEQIAAGENKYTEWELLNGMNIKGLNEEGKLVDAYLDLAGRLRVHDAGVNWHKIAEMTIPARATQESNLHMVDVFSKCMDAGDVLKARYIKVVLKPFGKEESPDVVIDPVEGTDALDFNYVYQGDRTKINEICIDRLAAVDGIDVPCAPAPADAFDEVDGSVYDYHAHKDADGFFLPEKPFNHRYNRKMMLKFYMAEPDRETGTSKVMMNYEQALENIRKINNITLGVEKIVYLVGWNALGHDDGYPTLSVFNEALKRPDDTMARESLVWLQEEAKKYNTTVSVHVTINDAYTNSPDWNTYLKNDMLCRNADGSLLTNTMLMGQQLYRVNIVREWEKGYLQKRIRAVTDLCRLADVGTVHIDAFFPLESPYHDTSKLDSESVMRKVIRYWRSLGVDVTGEFFINNHQREDPMYGLQAAAWWNDVAFERRVEPGFSPALACGGMSGYCGTYFADSGFLLGDNMHGEQTLLIADEAERWAQFKHEFCTTSLPGLLLNDLHVESYGLHVDGKSWVQYNKGVRADYDDATGHGTITGEDGKVIFRDGNDLMFHITWSDGAPIMYSENGYENRTWKLSSHWADLTDVKVFEVTPEGLQERGTLPVTDGTITLSMQPREMLVLNR